MSKHFAITKVEKSANSEAEILGTILLEFIKECRVEALKELGAKAKIPGFRPGHIPEDVLVKNIGEMHVLEEAAEIALGKEYADIMKEAKLNPISRPEIAITKLAPGIALEFKIKVALEPEFKLPEYKKIAKEVVSAEEAIEVTDKEIDDVLEEIKKRDWKPDLKEGEDIREKVKENLTREKEFRAKEKRRLTIVDKLVAATEIPLPSQMVASELARMIAQFKDDIQRAGLKWDDYMKKVGKSEEEIKIEWEPKARERAKAELIVGKIAEAEKIEPDAKEVEHEAAHLLEHYPDADPLRARIYIFGQLRNEKVFEFLESQR